MERYCVRLTVSLDMEVYAQDPDEAYVNAIAVTEAEFGKAFTNMTVIAASVSEEPAAE